MRSQRRLRRGELQQKEEAIGLDSRPLYRAATALRATRRGCVKSLPLALLKLLGDGLVGNSSSGEEQWTSAQRAPVLSDLASLNVDGPKFADERTDFSPEHSPMLCVVTAASCEYDAVFARLEPAINDGNKVLRVTSGDMSMLVGKLGNSYTALLRTDAKR